MFRRTGIALLMTAAAMAAADKPNLDNEIKELQRDVAQLQEMVKTLQGSFEQRLAAVAAQVQGIGASVDKVSASVGALQKGIQDVGPVVAQQGARIEHANESLNTVQQAMADLTASVNKLQTQVGDVGNTLKVLAAPPVAPPGSEKPAAADLINNAQGDESGGKAQLALQEYSDYLKWYGDTPMANVALFRIGNLNYQLKDYAAALDAFDALAQKFPDSTLAPDALLLKRKSLQALGKSAEAAAVCQELRKRFPGSEQAKQCVVARR
jgi:TolA-binding protein